MSYSISSFTDPIGFKRLLLCVVLALAAPTVAGAAGAPIPVLPVDVAGPSQIVNLQRVFSVTSGFGTTVLYTVPAGKRLIIETAAATTESASTSPNEFTVLIVVNNFGSFIAFPTTAAGILSSGTTHVRFYAEAGTPVTARVFGKSTVSDTVGVSISGYLVDATGTTATSSSTSAITSVPSVPTSGIATMP